MQEEPLDLYAEFARLCGAPADMDWDGQIELFQQYQRDFDEMKEALFKDKTYEEQEELANTFIADWVANTKAKMADRKKKPTAPPEAYAAFVRIYLEWMERDEEEKITLVERSVNNAAKLQRMYALNKNYSQFLLKKGYTTLYGADFEDYVNEVWVKFLEACSDVDQFAVYLQENFDKNMLKTNYHKHCQLQFNRMVDNFIKRAEKDWKKAIEKYDAEHKDEDKKPEEELPQELEDYLDDDCAKRCAELAKIKKEFDETTAVGYPSLWLLLRRPAQNMMGRLLRNQSAASQTISIEVEAEDQKRCEFPDVGTDGIKVEDELALQDFIDHIRNVLDEKDREIFDLKASDYSQKEIAEKMGVSNAAISKRMKKIKDTVYKAMHSQS